VIRKDGLRRNIRISAAPNIDSLGEIIGSVGVFEDITEQQRNEAIRFQQEQEIDFYGSLLRHDLANDLGLILRYVEAVQMLMDSPNEEVMSFLNSALATVDRMAALLKSFGRPQEIDIVEFIKGVAEEAQEAEKGLQVLVSYKKGTNNIQCWKFA